MRGAGTDAQRSGTGPIHRKTRMSDPEAGSDRLSHGRLHFLRDEGTQDIA